MQLYKLSEKLEGIFAQLEESDGELTADIAKQLDSCESEIVNVVESCCKRIKNQEAEIDAFKSEIARLNKRKKTVERDNAWLKQYVHDQLIKQEKTKLSAGTFKLTRRANSQPSLCVIDETAIPDCFRTTTLTMPSILVRKELDEYVTGRSYDKTVIKDALKHDVTVCGCALEQGEHLLIK